VEASASRYRGSALVGRRWRGLAGKLTSPAWGMITCVVEYIIVPAKIDAFERFARRWIELVGGYPCLSGYAMAVFHWD
jgi:hypothetical protein